MLTANVSGPVSGSCSSRFPTIGRKVTVLATLMSLTVLGACSTAGTSSSNPVNTSETLATATNSVELDDRPTDSITDLDVINRKKDKVTRTGEIYLMRGLANVFSRGIDQMTHQLRTSGYDASNFSYTEWRAIAEDIVNRSRNDNVSYPVIIVGHSLGANESSKFANYVATRGVPVELVVAFDPVETGKVGPNIKKVVNYYLPKSQDNRILETSGFEGSLENINVTSNPEITHVNVDKNPAFQQAVISDISQMTKTIEPQRIRARRYTSSR
jgi:hypothetical protein